VTSERLILTVAAAFFLAGTAHAAALLRRGMAGRQSMTALGLMLAGFLCQCVFLSWRGQQIGRCPVTNPFELLTFTAWSMVLFYFVVGSTYRLSLMGAFTAPLAFVLQSAALLRPDPGAVPARTAPGFWTELHASLSLMAYGAFALACVTGVMFLVQDRLLKRHRLSGLMLALPPVHYLGKAIRRLLLAGTVILSAGIVCAYRMKELPPAQKLVFVWLIWAVYAALVGYEYRRGMSARRAAWAAAAAFLLPVVSLWFVARR
jgi:HemX protein